MQFRKTQFETLLARLHHIYTVKYNRFQFDDRSLAMWKVFSRTFHITILDRSKHACHVARRIINSQTLEGTWTFELASGGKN